MLRCKSSSIVKPAIILLAVFFALSSLISAQTQSKTEGQVGALAPSPLAQITGGVKANFGVEGDLYADTTQFGGFGAGLGTDDWFDKWTGGGFGGVGVIDTTGGGGFRALIQAGGAAANVTFVRRMAFPYNSVVNGYFLFDAIYARDNHATQSSQDSSVFGGTKDKNGDNPRTWNLDINGTPQKNDLVDGVAHMRYDGPTKDDSLWLFVGSSTISADGDAHNDYEFFRVADTLLPGATQLTGTGPDSGHTAWRVIGGNLEPGDLILSVDFENGGENPIPSLRLWIEDGDQTDIEAHSDFVFTGDFNGGLQSGNFGYAEIEIPAGVIYARVNGLKDIDPPPRATLAAPWGSLESSQATFYDSVQALQFSEAGINLSAMGLDVSTTGDPCADLFGYILFKTRSSQSFTAELKDFIGPFPFGQVLDVECSLNDERECETFDATFTASATGGDVAGDYSYCWEKAPYDGVCDFPDANPLVISAVTEADEGDYRVIVTDDVGCADTCEATLTVDPRPECDLGDERECEGFDATFNANATGGTGSYSYCWEKAPYDGVCDFPDADPLVILAVTEADEGDYRVIVTDELGCADTCYAYLTVVPCGCTFTIGGWGSGCPESQQDDRYSTQPGCIRDHFFSQVFPEGVWIGNPENPANPAPLNPTNTKATATQAGAELTGNPPGMDQAGVESMAEPSALVGEGLEVVGPTNAPSSFLTNGFFWALWEDSSATAVFLRSGGGPALVLTDYLTNPAWAPITTGNWGRQILGLRLNVEYTCAGIFDSVGLVEGDYCYGDFIISGECGKNQHGTGIDIFTGMTVDSFLTVADSAIGGQLQVLAYYGATMDDINWTASCLNELFSDCDPYAGMTWSLGAGGSAKPSSEEGNASGALPEEFSLSHGYPNPFNPVCNIEYALPTDCQVTLAVYNILGRKVRVLVDDYQSAGYKSVKWDGKDNQGRDLASGIYFYRIEAEDFVQTKKMVLMK